MGNRINEAADVDIVRRPRQNYIPNTSLGAHANRLMPSWQPRAVYMTSPVGMWSYPATKEKPFHNLY